MTLLGAAMPMFTCVDTAELPVNLFGGGGVGYNKHALQLAMKKICTH